MCCSLSASVYKNLAAGELKTAKDLVQSPIGIGIRPFCHCRPAPARTYDRPLSGMERPTLLASSRRPPARPSLDSGNASGKLAGFGLGREGRGATSIGPVIATVSRWPLALVSRATTAVEGPFIIDVPDAHSEIGTVVGKARRGATPRAYVRMTLGTAKKLDDPSHVFALAGPNWDRMAP